MDMPPGPQSMNTNSSPSGSKSDSGGKDNAGPWIPSEALPAPGGTNSGVNQGTNASDEIQLSFQGANIDMVVQWLAQTTGKSVVKHPRAQCQLTIMSSKKVSPREAVNLVYRALALEGFTAIEFTRSILIVPEGQEPKMSPAMVDASQKEIPEGRQRLVKVFSLKHLQAGELKDRIKSALTDKATVEVDERANQIVITDYNDNIRLAGELIEALDTDRAEDVTVRVLTLKHIGAQDLAKEITPIYQKRGGKSLRDLVDVAADDRSNALIVLSSEANFHALEVMVAALDTEDAQEKVMHTFALKNADAQDVAKQLQDLNQDQGTTSRYAIYYSSDSSPKNTKKLSVVADRRRNAVIVQAPPAQMDGIEKMIEELDAPVNDDSLAPRIYHLKYVSAVDIEDVLNELFLKKQAQRSYWDYYFGDASDTSTGQDVGRLYGKVRITSEPYSNTIIVTSNSKENLAAVEDVLKQLDQPSEAGESTLHVGLKFAKASTVANCMNVLFAKNGSPPLRAVTQQGQTGNNASQSPQQSQQATYSQSGFDLEQETREEGYYPWLGGQPDNVRGSDGRTAARPVSDLVGRVRTVADQRGNALLISANVHFFPQVLKLVEELDAPTDQVLIEARLVEVSTDLMDRLGVRWSPNGSTFTADDYNNSFLLSSSGSYTKGFGGNTANVPFNTSSASSGSSVSTIITSLRSGVVQNSISMDFLVQFLRQTTHATVMAQPQINIRDNETGRLFVGQQVPIPDNTQVSQLGGQNTSFKYKDVGVVLEVTPHINTSGDVELKVHAESSTVVPGQTVLGGAVFDSRAFKTDLTAKNGQTLVLGGIIQKQVSETLRKTPVLGDIPGLGWAFKKKDKSSQDVELMVFLRPRVVRTPEDAKALLDDVDKKAPLVKQYQDEAQPDKPKAKKK
jgi:general secretion pathway protein D